MITTKANSRTTPQRRSSGRPARGTRRTAPAIEGLEDRRLLSIAITEFPIPTANADTGAIAAGPDGNIWFTEPDQNQVARINPTTHVITEFPEPAGTGPLYSLVAAPDGFLYAIGASYSSPNSDSPLSHVIRINPANGAMTIPFAISNATDNPGNIAVGPDGNLWFTELNGIGELDPRTGNRDDFTNESVSSPKTIAAGPDGALWFTDPNVSEVGRIDTTTKAIVEYPTPTSGAYPEFIAAGPDGNMWFTEDNYANGQVGLINPTTRAITEIPISDDFESDSEPLGLTAGADGNMWLTNSADSNVTEIDVNSHSLTDYPLPDSSGGAYQITLGPDGNLWFTGENENGSAIGEVSGSAVVQPLAATQTAVSSSANPSTVGQPVTFTAVVTAASYQGTPTGTVTFTIDGQAQTPVPLALVGASDQAQFTTRALSAGSHTVSASYSGDDNVSASSGSLSIETVTAPNLQTTTTTLASSLNPSTVGQSVTFTAVVSPSEIGGTPSGSVTFTIDGVSQAPVPLKMVSGRDQAALSIASLGAGRHTISAAYGGSSSFAASAVASPLVQLIKAVPAPAGDGPKVELVQRFGVHMQPTVLVVSFNEALDPASAVDRDNYKITDPSGRSVRIRSAVFDAATNTVMLSPADRINLHHTYHLTLVGTGPGGIRNTQGELLDGADTGTADSDYKGTLTWRNVVLTPAELRKYVHPSQAKPAGALNHHFHGPIRSSLS
jgi:streptogramin lyase